MPIVTYGFPEMELMILLLPAVSLEISSPAELPNRKQKLIIQQYN